MVTAFIQNKSEENINIAISMYKNNTCPICIFTLYFIGNKKNAENAKSLKIHINWLAIITPRVPETVVTKVPHIISTTDIRTAQFRIVAKFVKL